MSIQPEFTFGDYLRGFRTRQDMSRAELAKRLRRHPNTIYNWERGGRPEDREDVLPLETELSLSPDEIDLLLHVAGFVPKYDANVARFYSSDGVNAALPQPGSSGWNEGTEKIYGYLRMERGADEVQYVAVKGDKIIVGRHPDECTLVVPPELTRVSRVHAAVYPIQEDVYVEDLDSLNGTYIDGVRVTERTRLQPGQHLLLGGGVPFSRVFVLQFVLVPSSTI